MIFARPFANPNIKPGDGAPLYDPEAGVSDVTEGYVYSTCALGQEASGRISLFTVPKGQQMPRLGGRKDAEPEVLTELHTNITRAGELGPGIGDAAFKTIRVVGKDLAAGVEARLTVRVSGKNLFQSPLAPLLSRETRRFEVPILVARSDTLEVIVEFDEPLTPNEVPSGWAHLRVELGGVFARDAR
jgi:hypothetical protein